MWGYYSPSRTSQTYKNIKNLNAKIQEDYEKLLSVEAVTLGDQKKIKTWRKNLVVIV